MYSMLNQITQSTEDIIISRHGMILDQSRDAQRLRLCIVTHYTI